MKDRRGCSPKPNGGYGGRGGGRGGSRDGSAAAYHGARPFAPQRGGRSPRSWSRKKEPKRPTVSLEDRMTQPIKHVVPLDISFGNFEFQEMKSIGKRGGGVRELSSLLRQARRKAATHADMLHTRQGAELRSEDLISAAMQRAAGLKVKDDPHRIAKALAKRRSKKRQSAKRWAKRIKHLEDSVENIVKDRSIQKQTMKARKEAKVRAKEKKREASGGGGGKGSAASGSTKKKAGKGGGGSGGGGGGGKKSGAKKQRSAGGKQTSQRKGGSGGGKRR